MEIALNSSVVATSPSSRTKSSYIAKAATFNGFLPAPAVLVQTNSSGTYAAGGGFKNDSGKKCLFRLTFVSFFFVSEGPALILGSHIILRRFKWFILNFA